MSIQGISGYSSVGISLAHANRHTKKSLPAPSKNSIASLSKTYEPTFWDSCLGVWERSALRKTLLPILKFFGYGKPALTAEERENRTRDDVPGRLAREYKHAQNQMASEKDGAFRYLRAKNMRSHSQLVGKHRVGICHAQGKRPSMEDEHLATSFVLKIGKKKYPVALFGIFDGHGGPEAARYVKKHLAKKLEKTLKEFNPEGLSDEGIWNALKLTFVRLNQDFKKDCGKIADKEGTTATGVMILDGKIWTANVGDSRTVAENAGEAIQLSEDAKPGDPRYQRGIKHRGGVVIHRGVFRVNGNLAIARSIGDHGLKGAVSARPKITMQPIDKFQPGSHLILGCDGLFDVASTRQVVKSVHDNRKRSPAQLSADLTYSALQADSLDNVSSMVIRL